MVQAEAAFAFSPFRDSIAFFITKARKDESTKEDFKDNAFRVSLNSDSRTA
jgi:hypothetical protein